MKKIINRTIHTRSEVRVIDREDGGGRTIRGYVILFNVPSVDMWEDEDGVAREEIAPEAVTRELLDSSDIKFTMFHDRQLILARSNKGQGTLSYDVDERGVSFEFEAPNTIDGDKALELVRRGDLSGCSFAFSTYYNDRDCVKRIKRDEDGKTLKIFRVVKMTGIYDFTLAADPAYPDTSVGLREMIVEDEDHATEEREKAVRAQIDEMRRAARLKN